MSEKCQCLDAIAAEFLYTDGLSNDVLRYASSTFGRYICGGTLLEMGPAEGYIAAEVYVVVGVH